VLTLPTELLKPSTRPSENISYPILLVRLGGPHSRPNPFEKIFELKVPGIKFLTLQLVVTTTKHSVLLICLFLKITWKGKVPKHRKQK
jgi:hypothetical protein